MSALTYLLLAVAHIQVALCTPIKVNPILLLAGTAPASPFTLGRPSSPCTGRSALWGIKRPDFISDDRGARLDKIAKALRDPESQCYGLDSLTFCDSAIDLNEAAGSGRKARLAKAFRDPDSQFYGLDSLKFCGAELDHEDAGRHLESESEDHNGPVDSDVTSENDLNDQKNTESHLCKKEPVTTIEACSQADASCITKAVCSVTTFDPQALSKLTSEVAYLDSHSLRKLTTEVAELKSSPVSVLVKIMKLSSVKQMLDLLCNNAVRRCKLAAHNWVKYMSGSRI
jgi:hypothetical protein